MNKIDLLFVCDITGSMSGFIEDAKKRMKSILSQLSDEFKVDTKVGLSLYRDHPSQDSTFVTLTFDLDSIEEIQKKINTVSVDGGGDYAEAVFDGIIDGIKAMDWRKGSKRIAFLIGDAPPHGEDDSYCCYCGKTWGDVVQIAEENNVPIYSIPLTGRKEVVDPFKTLSTFTGGLLIQADNALDAVLKTLREELGDLNLSTKVLEMLSKDKSPEEICKMLNIDREKLSELETKAAVTI
jgi:von Willebrand factor type A domain